MDILFQKSAYPRFAVGNGRAVVLGIGLVMRSSQHPGAAADLIPGPRFGMLNRRISGKEQNMTTARRIALLLLIILMIGAGAAEIPLFSAPSIQKTGTLDPRHKEWLEIVSPIITKGEKDVFSKLATGEERDRFVSLFWKKRDPFPDTKENEFEQEYMKRIRFVDQNFGRGTSKRGRETERGRIYLVLGPPLERHIYATQSALWPLELWFYKGEQQYGLPPYFYLIFFQPSGIGEYRLYSPEVDGPMGLLIPTMASGALNRQAAYQAIREISAELGSASLSYMPGESDLGMTSMTSRNIVAGIFGLAEKKYSDAYARHYLLYKDRVEVDYSHNYIESSGRVHVVRRSGQDFLHWSLEPERINFAERGGRYQAVFQLILKIEDRNGRTILEKEEDVPLSVTPEEYEKHARRRFAFQDVLPVIPGEFRIFLLLKNKTTLDFTSLETPFVVSGDPGNAGIGRPILYHSRETVPARLVSALRAFTFSGFHYLVNARNEFPPQGEIGCLVPYAASATPAAGGPVRVALEIRSADNRDGGAGLRIEKDFGDVHRPGSECLDIGPVSLADLNPGYYEIEIALLDASGRKSGLEKGVFIILSRQVPVLPWVYAPAHAAFPSLQHLRLLASQHFAAGNTAAARSLLEKILESGEDPAARLMLGKTLHAAGDYSGSLAAVLPLYETAGDRESAKVVALNHAALGDWASALFILETLLTEAREIEVLNLAAECHLNLGHPEKALPLLKQSLSLLPSPNPAKDLEDRAKKMMDNRKEMQS